MFNVHLLPVNQTVVQGGDGVVEVPLEGDWKEMEFKFKGKCGPYAVGFNMVDVECQVTFIVDIDKIMAMSEEVVEEERNKDYLWESERSVEKEKEVRECQCEDKFGKDKDGDVLHYSLDCAHNQ